MIRLASLYGTLTLALFSASATLAAEEPDQSQQPSAPVEAVSTAGASAEITPSLAITDPSYALRAGDLLRVTVWKEDELDRDVLILPDGTIDFPLIGSFTAAGQSTSQLQKTIKSKLKPFIPSASVTVVVKETRGNVVSVMGQVGRPGDVVMNRALTVVQALSQVGGLTPYADDDSIVVLRTVDGKETAIPFDYSDIANGRNLDSNIRLMPGDVIIVPTATLF
jgi:polysaccharide export outer membrane protein